MSPQVPSVCVVMLAHNHERFARQAVQSVWEQDLCGESTLEILVHDDASSDDTAGLLKSMISDSPYPMRVVAPATNQFNSGWGFYRRLLQSVESDYIAFLECDDYWTDSEKVLLQVAALEQDPRIALSHHAFTVRDEEQGTELGESPPARYRVPRASGVSIARENFIGTLSVLLRRRDMPTLGERFDALPIADYPVWALATRRHDIGFVDRNMAVYRRHESNMFANESVAKRISAMNEARLYVASELDVPERVAWLDALARDWPLPVEIERSQYASGVISHLRWRLQVATDEANAMAERAKWERTRRKEAERALRDVLRSPSWRLTRPLRALKSLLKRRSN